MKEALREHWAPVCSPKSAPFKHLDAYLSKHVKQFEWSDMNSPSEEQLRNALVHASLTAPGPDGLPCSAWKGAKLAVPALHGILLELFSGPPPPPELNDLLLVFAPKGRKVEDASFVVREPATARPLALKSTGVKIVLAACNQCLKPTLSEGLQRDQRGFVAGRNFLDNITLLESSARIASMLPSAATNLPLLLLLDFGNAFPSLIHIYIYISGGF
eukprot:9489272-Pyramimonas_sp.AAC.1